MAARLWCRGLSVGPIIVIAGATGTGKSKLAVQIAKKFNGEIINADAMQMYKCLDIATNKASVAEQDSIPHHLLGILDPSEALTVHEFRNKALDTINDIFERRKLPVIVGGTNYYIEAVLYKVLVDYEMKNIEREQNLAHDENSEEASEEKLPRKKLKLSDYESLSKEELMDKLKEVDPEMAEKIHPNDRRKLWRSLQVYVKHGETLSSVLKKQRSLPGGCDTGGPLRFTDSVVLLLQCENEVLNSRLDARVDSMMNRGLLDELIQFHEQYNKENLLKNSNPNYTKGILQSIGFKEFHEYLTLDKEKRGTKEGEELLTKGIKLLKIATRQYAKRQYKWITNRFLRNSERQVPPIYGLDATDESKWEENVYSKAELIVDSHLSGKQSPISPLPIENSKVKIDKIYKCEICNISAMGKQQWEVHIKSIRHRRTVKRKERKEKAEENPMAKEEMASS